MPDNNTLRKKARAQLAQLCTDCGITQPAGKSLLEIGFKNALFLDECHHAGLRASGLEVNRGYHEHCRRDFPHLDLLLYDGRTFPCPDNTFDYVVSFQVLEHVSDMRRLLEESLRVLRPGGLMYHVCPNYHSFYEGHFKVIWLPCFGKNLGRLWLRLFRRYKPWYETLNFTTPRSLKQALNEIPIPAEILSLGKDGFLSRFTPEQIDKIDQPALRSMLRLLQKTGPLKAALLRLACITDIYYPLILLARKY